MLTSEMIDVIYRLLFVCMFFVVLLAGILWVAIKIKTWRLHRAYLKVHGREKQNGIHKDKP